MKVQKLTTLLVVDAIEPCLGSWSALGYEVTDRVPAEGPLAFAILTAKSGEIMFQTKASLQDDLPAVAERGPTHVLYAVVDDITEARKALRGAGVLVAHRQTFYGATETWLELEGGAILGLAERAES